MLSFAIPRYSRKANQLTDDAINDVRLAVEQYGDIALYPPETAKQFKAPEPRLPQFAYFVNETSLETALIHTIAFDPHEKKICDYATLTGSGYPLVLTNSLDTLPLPDLLRLADYLTTVYKGGKANKKREIAVSTLRTDTHGYLSGEVQQRGSIQLYATSEMNEDTGLNGELPYFLYALDECTHEVALIHAMALDPASTTVTLHAVLSGASYPLPITTTLDTLPLDRLLQLADYLSTLYNFLEFQNSREKLIFEAAEQATQLRYDYYELEHEQVLNVYKYAQEIYIIEVLNDNRTDNPPYFIVDTCTMVRFWQSLEDAEDFAFFKFGAKLVSDYMPDQQQAG